MSVAEEVEKLIGPVLAGNRFEIVETQYRREAGRWVLRIFVDKRGETAEKPESVTLDDCERVSQIVGDFLDSTNVLTQSYTLEVSSPGINRPLKNEADFRRHVGQKVKVSLYTPLSGDSRQKNFSGVLLAFEEGAVQVEDIVSGATRIPLASIAKAHLNLI